MSLLNMFWVAKLHMMCGLVYKIGVRPFLRPKLTLQRLSSRLCKKRGDTIDLSKHKNAKEQWITIGEFVSDNDFVVAALSGLLGEYSTIKTAILTSDTSIFYFF